MSKLTALFSKWDDKRLARVGDPVRFRMAVSEAIAAGAHFEAAPSEETLIAFLDWASTTIVRSYRDEQEAAYRSLYQAFVADFPRGAGFLAALLPQVMDRYYNREERTADNVWVLLVAASFEKYRVRQTHGLVRMTSGAWWRASSMRKFASSWLRSEYARKNPVSTVYVETVRQVHQPAVGVPSYRGW